MKYLAILLILAIPFACQYSGFTDLTPDNGFKSEIAFNVLKLNEEISTTAEVQDSGWTVIEPIEDIKYRGFFRKNLTYISTDTFAFEWEDYGLVLDEIQRIANGFETIPTSVSSKYMWLNSGFWSNPVSKTYLIPVKNAQNNGYFIQVFRDQKSFFQTYYTARGIWIIGELKEVDGDVS